jgi:hypothetical protein
VKNGTYRKLFTDNNECDFLRQNSKFKCAACDEYNTASDHDKVSMEMRYQHHLNTNDQCKLRAKWRQSRLLKAEKRKLLKEQEELMSSLKSHQAFQPEMEYMN